MVGMTQTLNLTAAPDLADLTARIETQIWNAMKPGADRIGRTPKAAIFKVAEDVQAEARAKGWTPAEVETLRHIAISTGANLGRQLVDAGRMTREQFLAG
jgi:hypothetical protein